MEKNLNNNSNQFIINTTAIYENIDTLSKKEQERALESLIYDAQNLGVNIVESLNDSSIDGLGGFLKDIIEGNSEFYTDEEKKFLISLVCDTKKFKEYVNNYYDIKDDEKEKAVKELINKITTLGLTINKILNKNETKTDRKELSKLLLESLPNLYNCTEKQKKYLENSIKDGSLFKTISKFNIEDSKEKEEIYKEEIYLDMEDFPEYAVEVEDDRVCPINDEKKDREDNNINEKKDGENNNNFKK